MKRLGRITAAILCSGLMLTAVASAEDGVTDKEILLGQSCALNGPASALGIGMRAGLLAAFAEHNSTGKGRTISLKSIDDGYEPAKAIKNTKAFIETDKVFCLIGEVGTPTSKAVLPMADKAQVPFFGPFTGAGFLRDPDKMVINVRGSYFQEMEKLATYLVDQKKFTKIACLYQNDGYGQVGLAGITAALKTRGMVLSAQGNYERNTLAVKGALLKIRKAKPEAVVMVGAYKPCAEFIKLAKKLGMNKTVYCNISFVGTAALTQELGDAGEGCIISQVVVFPWDQSIPLVKAYQTAMSKYQADAKIGFLSLEGYMVGKLFVMAISKVSGDLTRKGLMEAVETTGTFDLGGVTLTFGPKDHQGMDQVFLTVIKNGKIQELGK